MKQKIFSGYDISNKLSDILNQTSGHKFLLVCDSAFKFLKIKEVVEELSENIVTFDGFKPNPLYEDVCEGVKVFRDNLCDAVRTVGSGSAIDVAKCIKLFSSLSPKKNYFEQAYKENNVPLIAIPTTAGTGSESTHFAVIYYDGNKISVAHESILPDVAVLDSSLLQTLPEYQKKCTMLDALCHGIESWWSVNSTPESIEFSKAAVGKIMKYMDGYLNGDAAAAEQILLAANLAGKAINITKTTAAHAMSYKLTSMFGLPHGHAVAICLPRLWDYMHIHTDRCVDGRGRQYLENIFTDIANALGEHCVEDGIKKIDETLENLGIKSVRLSDADIGVLVSSVNVERLMNNPERLTEDDFKVLYRNIDLNSQR